MQSLQELQRKAVMIARSAGQIILSVYHSGYDLSYKTDNSPLTTADLQAHEHILEKLQQLTPDIPVLSEESADIPCKERHRWQCHWLIDPLDGTREFIKGNGEFTVNIALIRENIPVIGVVYVPIEDCCYHAHIHSSAYKITGENQEAEIRTKSTCLEDMTIVHSRSAVSPQQQRFIDLFPQAKRFGLGSSWKLCLIAEGKCDMYPRYGTTSEWDTAAAHCIINAAGGKITDLEFRDLRYNEKQTLFNPSFLAFADGNFPWQDHLLKL